MCVRVWNRNSFVTCVICNECDDVVPVTDMRHSKTTMSLLVTFYRIESTCKPTLWQSMALWLHSFHFHVLYTLLYEIMGL